MLKNFWIWIINILTSHKNIFIAAVITGLYLLTTAYVCTSIYDSEVTNGNWGSVSDILIAIFTGLISWATTLLLVIAAINLKEWKMVKEYDENIDLMNKLAEFYLFCFELRTSIVEAINLRDTILNSSKKLKGPELDLSIIITTSIRSRIEVNNKKLSLHESRVTDAEEEIYRRMINVNDNTHSSISDFLKLCKGTKSEFHATINPKFIDLTSKYSIKNRSLPKWDENELFKKYNKYNGILDYEKESLRG